MKFFFIYIHIFLCFLAIADARSSLFSRRDYGGGRKNDVGVFNLTIPGFDDADDGEKVCFSRRITARNVFVTKFELLTFDNDRVHQVALFACDRTTSQRTVGTHCNRPCRKADLLHAWSTKASKIQLPKDSSIYFGAQSEWRYIVVQVTYKEADTVDPTTVLVSYQDQVTKYDVEVYKMTTQSFSVPPSELEVPVAWRCLVELDSPINIISVTFIASENATLGGLYGRSGRVSSTKSGEWQTVVESKIAPYEQSVVISEEYVTVENADTLAARFYFKAPKPTEDSDDSDEDDDSVLSQLLRQMASSREDEISEQENTENCAVFFLYYTESPTDTFYQCTGRNTSMSLLPERRETAVEENSRERGTEKNTEKTTITSTVTAKVEEDEPKSSEGPPKDDKADKAESYELADSSRQSEKKYALSSDASWADNFTSTEPKKMGSIGGFSTDLSGNLYVFHRPNSDSSKKLIDLVGDGNGDDLAAIDVPTVSIFSEEGRLLDQRGTNTFYSPMGIDVNEEANAMWLTDLGLNQVFRFDFKKYTSGSSDGTSKLEPDFVLGKRFHRGSKASRKDFSFCGPSGVVSISNNKAAIADGICNSRVVIVNQKGEFVKAIDLIDDGKSASEVVGIVHDPLNSMIVTADSGNQRIFTISTDTWNILFVIKAKSKPMSMTIFSPGQSDDSRLMVLTEKPAIFTVNLAKPTSVTTIGQLPFKAASVITALSNFSKIFVSTNNGTNDIITAFEVTAVAPSNNSIVIAFYNIENAIHGFAEGHSIGMTMLAMFIAVLPVFALIIILVCIVKCFSQGQCCHCRRRRRFYNRIQGGRRYHAVVDDEDEVDVKDDTHPLLKPPRSEPLIG